MSLTGLKSRYHQDCVPPGSSRANLLSSFPIFRVCLNSCHLLHLHSQQCGILKSVFDPDSSAFLPHFKSPHWAHSDIPRLSPYFKVSWLATLISAATLIPFCHMPQVPGIRTGMSNSFSPWNHISLEVAFKGLNVILGLYKYNYSLTVKWELRAAAG